MSDAAPQLSLQEVVELAKLRDDRLRVIDLHLQIEAALRDDPLWQYLSEAMKEEQFYVARRLAEISATDTREILHLQARALMVKMIPDWIEKLRGEARHATAAVLAEDGPAPSD